MYVANLKFHPITKLRDLTSILLGLLVHLSAHYVRKTSIMNIKLIKSKHSPLHSKNMDVFLVGVSFGVQYITRRFMFSFAFVLCSHPGAVVRSEACPIGMQAAPSSIPTSGTFFRGDLFMKKIPRPLSLFC